MEEANKAFTISSLLAVTDNDKIKKKKKSNSVLGSSLFLFTPHCIKLKLMFPWDISGLFLDGTINTVMGQELMAQAVGVLSPTMFRPSIQSQIQLTMGFWLASMNGPRSFMIFSVLM